MYLKEAYGKVKDGDVLVCGELRFGIESKDDFHAFVYINYNYISILNFLSDNWEIEKKKEKRTQVIMIDTGVEGLLYRNKCTSGYQLIPAGAKVTIEWEE